MREPDNEIPINYTFGMMQQIFEEEDGSHTVRYLYKEEIFENVCILVYSTKEDANLALAELAMIGIKERLALPLRDIESDTPIDIVCKGDNSSITFTEAIYDYYKTTGFFPETMSL